MLLFFVVLLNHFDKRPRRHPGVPDDDKARNDRFGGLIWWCDNKVSLSTLISTNLNPNSQNDFASHGVTLVPSALWQDDKWNEGGVRRNGEHFDQVCKTERQLGVCWKSGHGEQKPLWEGEWACSLQLHLFYLCQRRPSILKYAKRKKENWWKNECSSSLFTCQQAVNDKKTNIYEGWPGVVEVGGCFPRTQTDGQKP